MFSDLYESHSVGRPFLEKNYKELLLKMEKDGLVELKDPQGKTRRKGKLPDRLIVRFC